MHPLRTLAILLIAALAAAACVPVAPRETPRRATRPEPVRPEVLLNAGIRQYENGNYEGAARNLQSALDEGLDRDAQKITAHKYLAFIHCVSGRERPCREEFRRALEINPRMELDPAEAGHPIWGPVFRSVKQKK